jgi:hypothetical protein
MGLRINSALPVTVTTTTLGKVWLLAQKGLGFLQLVGYDLL